MNELFYTYTRDGNSDLARAMERVSQGQIKTKTNFFHALDFRIHVIVCHVLIVIKYVLSIEWLIDGLTDWKFQSDHHVFQNTISQLRNTLLRCFRKVRSHVHSTHHPVHDSATRALRIESVIHE